MEEIEIPTEGLSDEINDKAGEATERKEMKWVLFVAISTALMAVFAAIGGLMAGHYSEDAMRHQIKASDQWAFYQAKGIKADIRELQPQLFPGSLASDSLRAQQAEIMKKAKEEEEESEVAASKHELLAPAVTLLQISIAISAIAIITNKKFLWLSGIALAAAGLIFFVWALVS
ncbi:MAG TPA: DUF4337 family protein [Ferruginibacter sp.]|jgi:hypothetical protein|nr:DUF4337 family protein [Ferruginibacter sp.]